MSMHEQSYLKFLNYMLIFQVQKIQTSKKEKKKKEKKLTIRNNLVHVF